VKAQGPIRTPAGKLITGINIDDSVHSFSNQQKLTFNNVSFYLTKDSVALPVINRGGFKGVCLQLSTDVGLSSGAAGVTGNWTTFHRGYDYGGWFDSAHPSYVTVPAGVNQIIVAFVIAYTPTGTPGNNSYNTTTVRNNAAAAVPGGMAVRDRCVLFNNQAQYQMVSFPPIPVKAGDQIDIVFQSTWATATGMTVTASNTTFAVYANPEGF